MNYRRAWEGKEWQSYTLLLVQHRHGASNIQRVPDKVQGDAGIEFFSLDGCLYQSYAPEEAVDVAKASSATKVKATRDLGKLIKYKIVIANILQTLKARRWILLCPFVDDKAVVAHARQRGEKIAATGLSFIADNFEAMVQSQEDFAGEIEIIRRSSVGPHPLYKTATEADVAKFGDGDLSNKLGGKLGRAFPNDKPKDTEKRKASYISSHITRENALDEFRREHPILWEKITKCIESQEHALALLGSAENAPIEHMRKALSDLQDTLKADLPTIDTAVIAHIAYGTLSDWLMRCPMDFPKDVAE